MNEQSNDLAMAVASIRSAARDIGYLKNRIPEKDHKTYDTLSKTLQAMHIIDQFLLIAQKMHMKTENPDYRIYQAIAAHQVRSVMDGV